MLSPSVEKRRIDVIAVRRDRNPRAVGQVENANLERAVGSRISYRREVSEGRQSRTGEILGLWEGKLPLTLSIQPNQTCGPSIATGTKGIKRGSRDLEAGKSIGREGEETLDPRARRPLGKTTTRNRTLRRKALPSRPKRSRPPSVHRYLRPPSCTSRTVPVSMSTSAARVVSGDQMVKRTSFPPGRN